MIFPLTLLSFAFTNTQVDILDGNVTRDSYGVLVLQSPGSPHGAEGGHHAHNNGEQTVRFDHSAGGQSPTAAVNHNASLHLSPQGHTYKKHFSSWDAVKSKHRIKCKL